jgi:hypothetical protein
VCHRAINWGGGWHHAQRDEVINSCLDRFVFWEKAWNIFEEVLKLQVNKKVQINNSLRSFSKKGYYFCFLKVCIVERARLSCFSLYIFRLDSGLSGLTSLQFIICHAAGFYKPTIPQSPPSHLRDNSTCNNASLEFFLRNGHSRQIRVTRSILARI